jgi:DNA-binding response OmpR family regulator
MSLRILLVSNQESIQFAVCEYFRQLGYLADCCGEADQVEKQANAISYDLLLIDLPLDRQISHEYFQIVVRIRRTRPTLKIVMLTAERLNTWKQAQVAGVHVIFEKPKQLNELAAAVASLLSKASAAS